VLKAVQLRLDMPEEYSKMNVRLEIRHDEFIDKWLEENHYLDCAPAGARVRMAFYSRQNELIGGMMWGRPTARKINQETILELTRMHFIDDTLHCIESHCLGMARKYIRKNLQSIKGLIAYSSKGEGHEGTVYEADGWFQLGVTELGAASWESREGRKDRDKSNKIRWVRSP
jgi:hypothetical protein